MPDIESNRRFWAETYDWDAGGEEWSEPWGDSDQLWHTVLWPRLRQVLPASRVVEIASGYGRVTEYLRYQADSLTAVDMNENCCEACRRRFVDDPRVVCVQNDGRSLNMIADNSTHLVVSFDSLVHVDNETMAAYIREARRVLTDGGHAFLHHSNLGGYWKAVRLTRRLRACGRDRGVSATSVAAIAHHVGLGVIVQETLTWPTISRFVPTDCFTLLGTDTEASTHTRTNRGFARSASDAAATASLY
jgi:SAM-dependent methyltransferase